MSAGSLRIGVWNLEHGAGQSKNARRLERLSSLDADVWILTETNDRVAPEGHAAVHSAPRRGSPPGGRWVSIWSRLPILQKVEVNNPARSAAVLLASPLGDLLVLGTVLPWHSDRGEDALNPAPKNWQEQNRVVPLQAAEWAVLRRAFPGATLCVAGDLNMSLSSQPYYGTRIGRQLLEAGMVEAELACVTRQKPPNLRYPLIDHVLLDQRHAENAHIVAAWEGASSPGPSLSDHSGVLVEVRPRFRAP